MQAPRALGDDFSMRAVVLDANGCFTSTPHQWKIDNLHFADGQTHAGQPTIDLAGKLSVPTADFADATFEVIATAAGRSAKASIQATSPANYEAMLAGVRPRAAGRARRGGGRHPRDGVDRRDRRPRRGRCGQAPRDSLLGVIGALGVLLGVVAFVGIRRSRKGKAFERAAEEAAHAERMREFEDQKRAREEKHAAQMQAHLDSVKGTADGRRGDGRRARRRAGAGVILPLDARREPRRPRRTRPFDSNRLVPVARHENMMMGPAGGVCPTCKRGSIRG